MPNWCANRLMFNDISQDNNVLNMGIAEGHVRHRFYAG